MKLTVRDVAYLLNVSPKEIYRWIKRDEFPAYRIKERYRCNSVDVLEWATARKIHFRPELVHGSDMVQTSSNVSNSLVQALEAGGVHSHVPGHDKASVIRALVDRLLLPSDVDREFASQVLLAREKLGSTAIGEGIAIPHTRNPLIFHVDQPLVTLCFLESPVDYAALDGLPVHTVFALVCPTINSHLALLSQLAHALKDATFSRLIKARAPREDLLAELRRLESRIPAMGEKKSA